MLEATGLHCSVGIGDNKVRAKIATGFGKPRGVFRLTRDNWFEVMGDTADHRPVGRRVQGLQTSGRATGSRTVRELADADESLLVGEFGPRMGVWYSELGRGIGSAVVDDSPWIARGHSRETTFQHNLTTPEEVRDAVRELASQAFDDTLRGRASGLPGHAQGPLRAVLHLDQGPQAAGPPRSSEARSSRRRSRWPRPLEPGREVRLLGVRAEMVMPDGGDATPRTPVRGRL